MKDSIKEEPGFCKTGPGKAELAPSLYVLNIYEKIFDSFCATYAYGYGKTKNDDDKVVTKGWFREAISEFAIIVNKSFDGISRELKVNVEGYQK